MKLSEALRYLAQVKLGVRKPKLLKLRDVQYEHWDCIRGRFDTLEYYPGWYDSAENNEHRAMILLFAAEIAEDEGD